MKTKQFIILDDVDWRILEILQENGKETYTEIGRKLHLAHSTVYDRIKRMESKGIIRKYTAIIDLEKCGVKHLVAILTIYTDPKRSEKIAEQVSQHKQVPEVFISLSEELLIIAKVIAEDREMLHSFIAKSVAPIPGVLRVRTAIITKKYKEEDSHFLKRV